MLNRLPLQVAFALPVALAVAAVGSTSYGPVPAKAMSTVLESEPSDLEHSWVLQEAKHWQIASSAYEDPGVTDAIEGTRGKCAEGMVEVRGRMKMDGPSGSVEAMQRSMCTHWIAEEFPERCGQFDEARWKARLSEFPTAAMNFCIDRYEYPNVKGQYPWAFVTWTEAADICKRTGKRLCSEAEWTFACEGEEAWPYPYGFERSSAACVIDYPWREYDERRLADRSSETALRELDCLWQGEASGSRPACRSPFGVYDMTGNVDEWTYSTVSPGFRSVLKGGYWAEVRARCRPSTRVHGEHFALYQQGLRCCGEPLP